MLNKKEKALNRENTDRRFKRRPKILNGFKSKRFSIEK